MLSVNYVELVPCLIHKVKEQEKRISELEMKVERLMKLLDVD